MLRFVVKYSYGFKSLHANQTLLHYSTSTSTSTPTSYFTFANYLVDSLGFSQQQALPISTRLSHYKKVYDFKFQINATCVVSFFKEQGFDDTRLRKAVSFFPRLLCSNVHKTIEPKFIKLQHMGFSGSDIIRVISRNPNLLTRGLESCIVPAVAILKEILVSDALIIAFLEKKRCRSLGGINNSLLPNVALLTSYRIPIDSIRKHLLMHPSTFLLNSDIFKDKVTRVEKKLEITPSRLLYLIKLLCNLSEASIQSKCRIFKSFGWTQTDVQTLMIKNSHCFSKSDESIEKKLDFLMNELRFTPAYLTSNSAFLICSLEKRLLPRHIVLLILKEKGLLKKFPSLNTAICLSEIRFLNKFVLPFKEVHEVYAKHTGCSVALLINESTHDRTMI